MYSTNFNPYARYMPQVHEEEIEDQESEQLIEEVDPNYQPTAKEIRDYAIDTLGMSFPQDEGFLYLAKEGLKAQMPPNWMPYQGRDGEVYYKHKITQEKTYDHPTDVEYRKKFEQQKERMARKSLKSMGLHAPKMDNSISNAFPTMFEPSRSKLDSKIEEEYSEILEEVKERARKQWELYETEARNKHEKRIKQYKKQHQQALSSLVPDNNGNSPTIQDNVLKRKKEKIKDQLEQQMQSNFDHQLNQAEKEEKNKLLEFEKVYRDEYRMREQKLEEEKRQEFSSYEMQFRNKIKQLQQKRLKQKSKRGQILNNLRVQLESPSNQEIRTRVAEALRFQLKTIRDNYEQMVDDKALSLENELQEINKVLGCDFSHNLQEMLAKKQKLKVLLKDKMESLLTKETQSINNAADRMFQHQAQQLQAKLKGQQERQLLEYRLKCQEKLEKDKKNIVKEYREKLEESIKNIYSKNLSEGMEYEKQMNKKLSNIRDNFIIQLKQRADDKDYELEQKLALKEKELQAQDKERLLNGVKRQLELERAVLETLKFKELLSESNNPDQTFKHIMHQYGINYRPEIYVSKLKQYQDLKAKYRRDKQLLADMMCQLQSNTFYSFYDRQKVANYAYDQQDQRKQQIANGSSAVIRQYNQNVRTMRQNQEMLRKMEKLLRKSQLNDRQGIEQLNQQFKYQPISVGGIREVDPQNPMSDLGEVQYTKDSLETKLKEHSKFLSNAKHDLNRKLLSMRNNFRP